MLRVATGSATPAAAICAPIEIPTTDQLASIVAAGSRPQTAASQTAPWMANATQMSAGFGYGGVLEWKAAN